MGVTGERSGFARFAALPADECERALLACCAAPHWAAAVTAARPYRDADDLLARADALLAETDPADVDAALAGHPRIGERADGDGQAARWSRAEQSGARDPARAQELVDANRAYEERFDRVFLIRAAGRSADEVLAELRRRLGNDDATEEAEVRRELRGITAGRLRALVGEP